MARRVSLGSISVLLVPLLIVLVARTAAAQEPGAEPGAAVHDIAFVIVQLFAIFLAAKAFGGIASMLKMPSIIGEIGAGVFLANTFLRDSLHLGSDIEFLEIIAELGVVFLIFTVGLETPFDEMKRVGGISLVVAVLGVIVPFAAGFGLMWYLGAPTLEGLFIGAALVATRVGITARVLADMGVIGRPESRIILGAAVIDDVLGLTILTIVEAMAGGGLSAFDVGILVLQAVAFVLALMYFGGRVVRRVLSSQSTLADRFEWTSPRGNLFALAMIVCLGLSALAAQIGLAAIIGAFLAGMAFAAHDKRHDLVERFEGVTQFTVPFFFAFIGLQLDLAATWQVAGLAAVVTILALATKVIGCGLGAMKLGRKSALAVGIGMMPRGEVGIIVALKGLTLGVIPQGLYGVVVTMSLLTTILTPPLLVWIFREIMRGAPPPPAPPAPPPSGH